MIRISHSNAGRYTLALIILTGIARIIIAATTGLGTGEAYYFRGVLDPQLSYFDQPPMFFWLGHLSIEAFGISPLTLRLPTILLFGGTTWFVYLLGKKLFNPRAGFFAAFILNISAVFTISIGAWFQPDSPLMFFWTVTTYCLIKILFPESYMPKPVIRNSWYGYKWWILTGVSMGVTTLSKYHVIFLLAGVLLFALFDKKHRHWIWHPGPYLALIINFAFATPIFLWNSQHNWVSFVFQGSRAGASGDFELHFDWFLRSIGGQALWLLPWVWLPLVWQLPRCFKKGKLDEEYKFIFWIAILPIVFFTVVTLWSDLGFHFHWQAPGYLMLFLPLGQAIDQNLQTNTRARRVTKRWLILSFLFTTISLSVMAGHMATGFWDSYGPKWFAGLFGKKEDPTMEGYDYDDIRYRFKDEGWYKNDEIFVCTSRWWLAGKIDWSLYGNKEVLILDPDPRNYAFLTTPVNWLGKDAIIITKGQEKTVNQIIRHFFDELKPLKDIPIRRGGKTEIILNAYYGKNFRIPEENLNRISELPIYRQLTGKDPFKKK